MTKVVRSQSPTSKTGLPNTRGEATSQRLPHSRVSAQTSDKGSVRMRMGRGEHNITVGTAPIIHVNQTWGYRMWYTTQNMGLRCYKEWRKQSVLWRTQLGSLPTCKSSGRSISWLSINNNMGSSKESEMLIYEKGDATLKDASNKHMDPSGRGET